MSGYEHAPDDDIAIDKAVQALIDEGWEGDPRRASRHRNPVA
jgi:hypothetical protein